MSVQVMDLGRWRRSRTPVRAGPAWQELGALGRAAAVVALTGVVVATVAWMSLTSAALATGAALGALTIAAVVDVAERRLPNPLVLAAALMVAAAALVGPAAGAVVGALAVGLPLLATHLVSPGGLGFGDVKAGTVLGGALGLLSPVLAPAALLVGLLASAAWAIAGGRRSVPLGPGLVGGGIAAAVAGRAIGVAPW